MKNIMNIFAFAVAAVFFSCTEVEHLPVHQVEFPVASDGSIIPIADLKVSLADGTVIVPGIDPAPVDGVYTAHFKGISYSGDISTVSYVLPEGATIEPVPPVITDSVKVENYGREPHMERAYWEREKTYTIKTQEKEVKVAFVLDDFVACRLNEDEPDPDEKGTVFVDLFDLSSPIPDETVWQLCKYASNAWAQHFEHVQGYETVRVEDGYLKLTARKDGDHYKNGGIRTRTGFGVGTRLEVRAKLTKKIRGGFPAIWQMPINGTTWPVSGEIDVMEWVQGTPAKIYQTIHYQPAGSQVSPGKNFVYDVTEWHTYAVDRTDDFLIFYVDEVETWRFANPHKENWKEYPFNRYDYDIILNLSLGGTLPDGSMTWPGAINDADLPGEMWVDWVRVIEL